MSHVPAIGDPELERKLSDGEIDMYISGLKVANQAASKQLARRLRVMQEIVRDYRDSESHALCDKDGYYISDGSPIGDTRCSTCKKADEVLEKEQDDKS